MSTINNDDQFLIQRGSSSYQINAADLMSTINDDDLLLIQRGQTSYNVTALDVKDQLGNSLTGEIEAPVEVLTPLNGAGLNEGQPYQPLSTAITAVDTGGEMVYRTDTIASVDAIIAPDYVTCRPSNSNSMVITGNEFESPDSTASVQETSGGSRAYLQYNYSNFGSLNGTYRQAFRIPQRDYGAKDFWYQINGGSKVYWWQNTNPPGNYWDVYELEFTGELQTLRVEAEKGGAGGDPPIYPVVLEALNPTLDGEPLIGDLNDRVLMFPTNHNFDKFEVGSEVQEGVPITAIDDSVPSITTDGGSWLGADGTGDAGDGRYEPSQEWSETGTPTYTGYYWSGGFDGITGSSIAADGTCVYTVDPAILFLPAEVSGTWRCWGCSGSGTLGGVEYIKLLDASGNELNKTFTPYTQSNAAWFSLGVTNNVRQIEIYAMGFFALEVDGKVLIDSSIPDGLGATDLTKTVSSDLSLTFTNDTELANMIGPLTQVDENGDVKTPATSEVASVSNVGGGPQTVWSAYWAGDFSNGPASRMFNGTGLTYVSSGTGTWTVPAGQPGIFAETSLEVLYKKNSGQSMKINGVELPENQNPDRIELNGIAGFTFPLEIRSMECSANTGSGPDWRGSNPDDDYPSLVADGVAVSDDFSAPITATLTFNSPNPDLQFFQPGDQIGTSSGFTAVLYTGNGGTQSIETGFSPDLVWVKARERQENHNLYDTIRGDNLRLVSNETVAQQAVDFEFKPNGFYPKAQNDSGIEYVAWCWDAGSTTVTNTQGSINSQVRSNGSFSVITWNGNGNKASVGHGLSSTPKFYFTKSTTYPSDWPAWHVSLNDTEVLFLNKLDAKAGISDYFDNSGPTSTTIPLDALANQNLGHVMYAWAETPGVSSFGAYQGQAYQKIVTGFRPAFVMAKRTTGEDNWGVAWDLSEGNQLAPNSAASEATCPVRFDDDGFYFTGNSNTAAIWNDPNSTYIYAAFAGGNPIEVVNVDVAANAMTVDNSGYEVGDTITGSELTATANDVVYHNGTALGVSDVSGNWLAGLYAQGAEVTRLAPSRDEVVFTSMNGDTTPYTGTDSSLLSRTWTLQKSNAATGPWTEVGTYIDSDVVASQDGATPWSSFPALEADTYYQVKVRYDASNAEYKESTFNTFKTALD